MIVYSNNVLCDVNTYFLVTSQLNLSSRVNQIEHKYGALARANRKLELCMVEDELSVGVPETYGPVSSCVFRILSQKLKLSQEDKE
jgi:hypothetical protein